MPYRVVKRGGPRPFKIIETATGKVVGSSISSEKADRFIDHRRQGDKKSFARFPVRLHGSA
jgi:hypothetical protein